jgi:hypothetical protein
MTYGTENGSICRLLLELLLVAFEMNFQLLAATSLKIIYFINVRTKGQY